MKYLFFLAVGLLCSQTVFADTTDSLFKELNNALEKKSAYESIKLKRIEQTKNELEKGSELTAARLYAVCSDLYEEYKTFNYDSAFCYAKKLQEVSLQINDKQKTEEVKLKLGFILLSSGMFKETFDVLQSIHPNELTKQAKVEYYSLFARYYFDLADFHKDKYYTINYNQQGNALADSAMAICNKNSYDYLSLQGLKNLRNGDMEGATQNYEQILKFKNLTPHQYAINASSLSFIYANSGHEKESIELLVKAAIADVKSATKETVAILNLADILYKKGDTQTAYQYIKQALADATYYGARHREIQIGAILPIIEGQQLSTVEHQRKLLLVYSILATVLFLAVVAFIFITIRQLKKLKAADKIIKMANASLQHTNDLLKEANKIKDEYIVYYFNICSEYIDKLERFKKSIEQKLLLGKGDDLKSTLSKVDLHKEREGLFLSFDKVFLKLFPNFVSGFNALLKDEDKIKLEDGQLMNAELRIFALIRIGITDNDRIAKILDYSVNTIYAYKTRIKKKSLVINDDFEAQIMKIQSV
ncbi:DUF6377 domain-containing protein [Solitalea sp. MAHUQ-68]|uniref:DUF6377 domain-containing protein n=1 Tax=Solitalea agri TaxID=2953739 RepID=A0A9X2EZP6_9SPHI|nr:DUF6377 domain-containing protein [Solitalea agri]MCO4291450.1 DUF6377 domain-containing protein [Solitalea agri]